MIRILAAAGKLILLLSLSALLAGPFFLAVTSGRDEDDAREDRLDILASRVDSLERHAGDLEARLESAEARIAEMARVASRRTLECDAALGAIRADLRHDRRSSRRDAAALLLADAELADLVEQGLGSMAAADVAIRSRLDAIEAREPEPRVVIERTETVKVIERVAVPVPVYAAPIVPPYYLPRRCLR